MCNGVSGGGGGQQLSLPPQAQPNALAAGPTLGTNGAAGLPVAADRGPAPASDQTTQLLAEFVKFLQQSGIRL